MRLLATLVLFLQITFGHSQLHEVNRIDSLAKIGQIGSASILLEENMETYQQAENWEEYWKAVCERGELFIMNRQPEKTITFLDEKLAQCLAQHNKGKYYALLLRHKGEAMMNAGYY
ncbi:MAG: hypothetical protein HKN32_05485, partial [Flavobacteriales bacterium]|nr:hypothetical protein [Flavobacteriales bacterium]